MKVLKHVLLLVFVAVCHACSQTAEPSKPNIILILADDLGYNDLSCYRAAHQIASEQAPTCETPHIDQLAEEGMRFTDFYCGAAVCSPSRSSLLTGRNSTRVGIYNWIPPHQPMHLRSEEVTIAEILREENYATAHFGKWHLTSEGLGQALPTDQGYDDSFFTYNNANPSHRDPVNFFRDGIEVGELNGYSCQIVVDEALAWLQSHEQSDQPFYINVWFNEPHEKVAAPEELTRRHTYNSGYYACIENLDLAVGRLMHYLESKGLDQNTVVIFTSDNGSKVVGSNDPLRGEKAFNFEGGIRVPFLIRWPGEISAGAVSDVVGSFTDVMPSLAAIAGAKIPRDRTMDGEDISGIFLGSANSFVRRSPLFFFRYFHDPVCMLRNNNWVLLGYKGDPLPYERDYNQPELANLKPDPLEQNRSMWDFQPRHMEYLKIAVPVNFELYDINTDISQRRDLSTQYPDVVTLMRTQMIQLRQEMIEEGGDWYAQSESKK